MYPGIAVYLFLHNNFEKLFVFTVAAFIGVFFFYQSYSIFKSVRGFIKRVIISTILVSGSLYVAAISPEAKNAFAGAILFLFIPSMFISTYLLYKSKPALKNNRNYLLAMHVITLSFFATVCARKKKEAKMTNECKRRMCAEVKTKN